MTALRAPYGRIWAARSPLVPKGIVVMNNQWNRFFISAGTLLAAASLATSAIAAGEVVSDEQGQGVAMSSGGEIPTRLSNEPKEDEPDGTCSICTVDDVTFNDDESGDTTATLHLYFQDDGENEIADVHVRVLLISGEYRFVTVSSVELVDGHLHVFELSPGSDWGWDEARYAWVEII